jgi:CCR4-NOT transcriptional regulation complex NOT5 subunit
MATIASAETETIVQIGDAAVPCSAAASSHSEPSSVESAAMKAARPTMEVDAAMKAANSTVESAASQAAMKSRATKAAAARGLGRTRHGNRHREQQGSGDTDYSPTHRPPCSIALNLFHRRLLSRQPRSGHCDRPTGVVPSAAMCCRVVIQTNRCG